MIIEYRTPAERVWLEKMSCGNPEQLINRIVDVVGDYFGTWFDSKHLRFRIIPSTSKEGWAICLLGTGRVVITAKGEFILNIIHELVHIFFPDWDEVKVEQTARAIFTRNAYRLGLELGDISLLRGVE